MKHSMYRMFVGWGLAVFLATTSQVANAYWTLTYTGFSPEDEEEPVQTEYVSGTVYNGDPPGYWNRVGWWWTQRQHSSNLSAPVCSAAAGIGLQDTGWGDANPAIPTKTTEAESRWHWDWAGTGTGYTNYTFDYYVRVNAGASAALWVESIVWGGYGKLEARAWAKVIVDTATQSAHEDEDGVGAGAKVIEGNGGLNGVGFGPGSISISWDNVNSEENQPMDAASMDPIIITGTDSDPGINCFIHVICKASVLSAPSEYLGEESDAIGAAALDTYNPWLCFQAPVLN